MNIDKSICGKTQVFGIIGDPVEHTFSPFIHNTISEMFGADFRYLPFMVAGDNLEDALKGAYALGVKGFNVTVPHKKAVMKYLCGVDEKASRIGAVNTLKYTENGYVGYNTDILGLMYALKGKGIEIKGKNVLIIGAGGSACAAVILAASEGAASVIIANRTVANAERLKEQAEKYYSVSVSAVSSDNLDNVEKCDLIIQTTTLGFGRNEGISPVKNPDFFKDKCVRAVFDVIYTPWETQILKDAKKAGITAVNGFDMLVYQAVASSEIWFETVYDQNTKEALRNTLAEFFLHSKR